MEKQHFGVRCHNRPGLCIFLRQHKRHQIDLSESPWAQHAVVSHTFILFVVGSDIVRISARAKLASTPVERPYTKCLIVAPMPPLCTPLMYPEQMIPERCGSSEKLSKLCSVVSTTRMHERGRGVAILWAQAHTTSEWVLKKDISKIPKRRS